jgi:DNA-binding SARP family transcriptional activator/TolB-like protein
MYYLRLLGGASLEDPSLPIAGRGGHRHRLALLALLAQAGEKGCSRDKLVAYLWPESDASHARHRLSDSIYVLRQTLGEDPVIAAGEHLWLNREAAWVDTVAFQEALERGDREAAARTYGGPFLDGFHLGGSREFEEWLESERARLADSYARTLESLARQAEQAGDPAQAVKWWKRLLAVDPYSSPVVVSLMHALAAAGDRANAIQQAQAHERLLRDELGMEAPPEVRALVERLRNESEPTPGATVRTPDQQPATAADQVPRNGPRRRAAIVAGAVAIWAAAVAAGYLLLRGGRESSVSGTSAGLAAAPAVAVLPFTVHGPGMELWREGLVDLLSVNLDLPALRAVDSRTVLARWRERAGEAAEPDLKTALEVARATQARHAVVGTAVSSGRDVRLAADVVDVETGEPVRQVLVDGPADSMIALVDRLSIELLRSLLGGRREGSVDLAARTTGSVVALKAFLEGEQLNRRGQYEAAAEAYARAVAADSTFALGWYHLGLSRGWYDLGTSGAALERASALAGALPRREAELLRAALAVLRLDPQWIDSARVLVNRYPDDAEAWFLLGELFYHQGPRRQIGYEETERAFQRSIQLDPTSAPHYLHLVDLAFLFHADSALAAERLARYRALAPRSPQTTRFELAFRLAFGGARDRRAALATLAAGPISEPSIAEYRLRHPRFWPSREELLRLLVRMGSASARRMAACALISGSVYQRGWLERGLANLGEPVVGSAAGNCTPGILFAAEMDVRALPEERLEPVLGRQSVEHRVAEGTLPLEDRAEMLANGAVYAALKGRAQDHHDLRERLGALAAAAAAQGDTLAQRVRINATITDGLSAWLFGDPEAAYQTLVDVPTLLDFLPADWWGRILLDSGRPGRAIPFFTGMRNDPLSHLYLGEACEAAGRDTEARAAYHYFLHWWAEADPALRPLLDEARRGLARVGRSPTGS